ncbi:MFS transporter [Vibrio breoganii]|uniref:MFS transporter n=1 Tax=Vibrio breoganii TaxID=553239 RepID=UPI000C820F5C|nr:MFS transporter [Vibrio breoganii]PMO36430.1 MFS transporter [Vibrio breoganii]
MNRKFLPHLSGLFWDGISSGLVMMALPWFLLQQGDMGLFVALTTLACTLSSFFLTPIFATFIDRYSRKAILMLVQGIQVATALILLLFTQEQAISVWVLAFAQFVFWLTNDLAWCTNNAFTQENYQKHEYASYSSYQEIVFQATSLGAGSLGIVFLELWGMAQFATFAVVASTLSLLSFSITTYHRRPREESSSSFSSQLIESKTVFTQQPRFYAFLALSCLGYPALTYLSKLIPIHFSEQSISASWFASWSLSYGIGALMCGFFVKVLLSKFATEKAMMACLFCVGLLILAMALSPSPQMIVGLTLLVGFFSSYNRIARTYKMNLEVDNNYRGRIDGGLKLFSTFSQSISYVMIAILSYYNAISLGFMILSIVLIIASLAMHRIYLRQGHLQLSNAC